MIENNNQNPEVISKTLLIFNAFLIVSIIIMVFFIYTGYDSAVKAKEPEEKAMSHAFDNVSLEAKSAYVFDVVENKVIFKKNEFAQLPLASITKLMMALLATEAISKDYRIIIKKEFMEEEGDSGLLVDESWRLKDLLDFSLLVSSNDGARSIASYVGALDLKTTDYALGRKRFIEKMNARALELGLKQTYFINESGLDQGNLSGGYGSAIDISKLMQYILANHPEIVEATKYKSVSISSLNKTHLAKNTNISTDEIPGLIASKTGYTELAGGNLVVVIDSSIGHPIIVVVLGSSIDDRFDDVRKLINASLQYISE